MLGAPLKEGVVHALHIQLIPQIRPLQAVIHLLQVSQGAAASAPFRLSYTSCRYHKALQHQHHPLHCQIVNLLQQSHSQSINGEKYSFDDAFISAVQASVMQETQRKLH